MRVAAGQRLLVTDPPRGEARTALPAWAPWIALGIIMAIGIAVRFARLDQLSLWLDEIYVVDYIRRPWRTVLGFGGAYDNHPPLYFAMVKTVSILTGEAQAARIVSAIAGSATIAVVFTLTRRLVGTSAALLASLMLALSPLHIWYSREGRMYAPAIFFVALSWYALLRFLPERNRYWGACYGVTLVLAAYTDYSVFYALAPQLLVVAWLAYTAGWKIVRAWILVVAVAALAFAPWAAQVLRSIRFVGDDRSFLYVTPKKVLDSFTSIVGLPGERVYYWGVVHTPWAEWPAIRPVAAALVLLVLVLAGATLSGRYRSMLIVGLALCFGTMIVTAVASYLVSPGYADRTVAYAVLGWAMLAGSAPFGRPPNGARSLALGAIVILLGGSLLAIQAVAQHGDKEHYRDLAMAAGALDAQGYPMMAVVRPEHQVIADSTGLVRTAISIYEPDIAIGSINDLGPRPVFWHIATRYPWEAAGLSEIQARLAEQGYVRVESEPFPPVMSLDLYVHTDLAGDRRQSISTWASATAPVKEAPGWWLEAGSGFAQTGKDGEPELLIYPLSEGGAAAEYRQIVAGPALYLVHFTYQIALPVGAGSVAMSCLALDGRTLASSTMALTPPDGADLVWKRGLAGIACPEGTVEIAIALANSGFGELRLRELSLGIANPAAPGLIVPRPWP